MQSGFRSALLSALAVLVSIQPAVGFAAGFFSRFRQSPSPKPAIRADAAPVPALSFVPAPGFRAVQPATAEESPSSATFSGLAPAALEEVAPRSALPPAPDAAAGETPTDSAAGTMALPQLEQLALAYNPTLCQLTASAQKASGFRSQVGRYPNPTVGYQGMQLGDNGTDQHVAYFDQQIVLGDKLALNRRVLNQEVKARLWELEAQKYRVLTDVRLRFYEALAAQRRVELTSEFHAVATAGVDAARSRVEALLGPRSELLQSEIQLTETETAQSQAELAFRGAWQELAAVAGIPDLAQAPLTGELRPEVLERDWDAFYQTLLSTSPERCAAFARVSRAQANIARQEAQPIPNLSVQLGAGRDNGQNSSMVNVQVGAPIPLFNRNQGNIDAACAEHCRAQQEVRRIDLSIKARLARAAQEFDSAAVAVRNFEGKILPRARETLELTNQAYAAGEFDFLQVLVARRTYFDSNLQYLKALGELAQANARLDGLLLSGGLDETVDTAVDDGLRGQTLSGQ